MALNCAANCLCFRCKYKGSCRHEECKCQLDYVVRCNEFKPKTAPTIIIQQLKMLTLMCPSQWEALSRDGSYFLIHFRYGVLSVFDSEHNLLNRLNTVEGTYAGYLTTKEMIYLLQDEYDFTNANAQVGVFG